jgi:hypothetical protein
VDTPGAGRAAWPQFRAAWASIAPQLRLSASDIDRLWPRTADTTIDYTDYTAGARVALTQITAASTDPALDWAELYTVRDGMFYLHRPSGAVTMEMPSVLAPPPVSEWLADAVHAHFALDDESGQGFLPVQHVWEKLQSSDLGLFLPPDVSESVVRQFMRSAASAPDSNDPPPVVVEYAVLARGLKPLLIELYASRAGQPNDWCYMHAGAGRGFFWANKRTGDASRTTPVDVLVALHTPAAPAATNPATVQDTAKSPPVEPTEKASAPASGRSVPQSQHTASSKDEPGPDAALLEQIDQLKAQVRDRLGALSVSG